MKIWVFGVMFLGFAVTSASASTVSASVLEREFHACFTGLESSQQTQKCLTNTHNKIKKEIRGRLASIAERDRTFVLNTKILQLNVSALACDSAALTLTTIKSCKLTTDLHALYYLEVRYG